MNQQVVMSVGLRFHLIGHIFGDAQQSSGTLYVQFNLTYWQRSGREYAGNLVCRGNSTGVCLDSMSVLLNSSVLERTGSGFLIAPVNWRLLDFFPVTLN